jgi:protein TonB
VGNLSPTYPQRSREVGESGVVLLAFDVDSAGGAANILVKESSGYPRLDQAAVESLRQSCFEPATENGKSVASHTELRISFELK